MWKREFFARVLLCITSVCDFLISAVWRKLTNRWCASSSVWDCVKQVSETFEILKQAFGDSCKSCSQTFEWFGRFKNGRTLTANDDRSGRPSTAASPSKVVQVLAVVNQDRHRTIRDLCAEVGIGYGSCQRILTEQLNMHRTAVKFVPRVLTHDQKDSRVAICQELKETEIMTPHSSWTSSQVMKASFMLTTQRQNYNLRNGRVLCLQDPKKHVCKKANWRQCSFVSLTKRGSYTGNLSHLEWRSMQTSTVISLRRLCENVRRKRLQKWQNQNLIIHHDNAPAHRSFKVSQFLAKNNMTVIPHPPYSPNLAPCDFCLFPKLKLWMKGQRFDTIEEVQEELQRVLDTIPKRDFQGCFQAWQKRWDHCIRAKGEYFEGDGGI